MSKRERRRKESTGWQDTPSPTIDLEDAFVQGFGIKPRKTEVPENAIVPTNDGTFQFGDLVLTKTGIQNGSIPDHIDEDQWVQAVRILREVDEAVQWAVGDLVNHATYRWGEKYAHYAELTGYTEKTLREYAYIARSVHLSIRMDTLSFGHHQLVAGIKDKNGEPIVEEQAEWLHLASENQWSIAALRRAMQERQSEQQQSYEGNWPFSKDHMPKVKTLEKLWVKAANGDKKARSQFKRQVRTFQNWIKEAEDLLDELIQRNHE